MTDKTLPRTGSFLFWNCKIKTCSKCKIEKELIEFSKNKNMKNGYRNQCRKCKKQDKKQWDIANAEHIKQYRKQYAIDNPDYIKQYNQTTQGKLNHKSCEHKRRALKKTNTPSGKDWTSDDIILKLKLQKYKCVYCEISIKYYHEVDHFVPLVKGGSNEPSNIQLLCKECNGPGGKWTKDAVEYAQKHGKLC